MEYDPSYLGVVENVPGRYSYAPLQIGIVSVDPIDNRLIA